MIKKHGHQLLYILTNKQIFRPMFVGQIFIIGIFWGRNEKRSLQATKKTTVVDIDCWLQPDYSFETVDVDRSKSALKFY